MQPERSAASVPRPARWLFILAFLCALVSITLGSIASMAWWAWAIDGFTLVSLPISWLIWRNT